MGKNRIINLRISQLLLGGFLKYIYIYIFEILMNNSLNH